MMNKDSMSHLISQIQNIPNSEVLHGLVFSVSGSSIGDLSTSNISLERASDEDDADSNVLAQVEIPPSVVDALSSLQPISPGDNGSDSVRITFNVYSTPALFISSSLRNFSETNEEINRTVNTPVLSLVIGEEDISGLDEFINFTFTPLTVLPFLFLTELLNGLPD